MVLMETQLSKRHVEFLTKTRLTTESSFAAALIISALSIGSHVFDFVGVLAFAGNPPVVFITEAISLGFVSGILAVQICLLAIWCSFGGQKSIWRLPLAITSLVLLINNWILASAAVQPQFSLENVNVIFAGVVGIFLLVQLPLFVIRLSFKLSIVPNYLIPTENMDFHFKIQDLFVVMAHAALLIGGTQIVIDVATVENVPLENMNFSEVAKGIAELFAIGLCVSMISLVTLGVIFSQKYRWRIVLLIFTLTIAGGAITVVPMLLFSNARPLLPSLSVEACRWFAFFATVPLGELLILLIFYGLGYRVKSKPA